MLKFVEVSQKITFEASQNIRSTTVGIPWATVVIVAVLGPIVISGFRRPAAPVAPITNLFSVKTEGEKEEPAVEDKDI